MYFKEIEIPEPLQVDPFRYSVASTDWNSCLGIQSDEHSYVFGFLKASVTLVNDVISNKKFGDRDTVVWPALYSVRHGIELGLKQLHNLLSDAGILNKIFVRNHSLDEFMLSFTKNRIGDSELDYLFSKLKIFVDSISMLDGDGQELRYFKRTDGARNLKNESIINLQVIAICAGTILEIFDRLYYRVRNFLSERRTKTYTNCLSRSDLDQIASQLPVKENWGNDEFKTIKASILKEFEIGSRQFSIALKKIEENIGLSQKIGIFSKLQALDDAKIEWLIRIVTDANNKYFSERSVEGAQGVLNMSAVAFLSYRTVENDILQELSLEELADLKTVFYIGRNNEFPEHYELDFETNLKNLRWKKDSAVGLVGETGFLSKINLADGFVKGLGQVGRNDLAVRMNELMTELREY